jgi:membrane-bound lytic murein transglycosylase A
VLPASAVVPHRAKPAIHHAKTKAKSKAARAAKVKPEKLRGSVFSAELGRMTLPEIPTPFKFPESQVEPIAWSDLEGWAEEDYAEAFTTFKRSCRAVVAHAKSARDGRPVSAALADVCRRALAAPALDKDAARAFFEDNLRPLRIAKLGDSAGFLTGYYEPVVEGSRFPTQAFKIPVYHRPGDLVAAKAAKARKGKSLPNGGRVVRRVGKRKAAPYFTRAQIEDGALDGRHLEICWLKDPIDLFFMQIQGSARVRLEDGEMIRLNYDSHNGYPYLAVGRVLIDRGIVPKDEMSMDRIRQSMEANPEEGAALRRQNRSYVFFRIVSLASDEEAVGAQGVPLTPRRSIAVDKGLHVYGTPFFIQAELPIESEAAKTKFRRFMVAQDTGSAILGPARADIYYGSGDEAGHISGRFKHPGQFVVLIPRALDPAATGALMPLPQPRPTPGTKLALAAAVIEMPAANAVRAADVLLPRPKPDELAARQ